VDVVPVVDSKDLARFIQLPHTIYGKDSRWVAPLTMDERTRLNPKKNPFFEHAEAAYFIARENGRDVGRIAASVDRSYDALHAERQAGFGFFEARSPAAAAALLQSAVRWGAERNAEVLRGPMSFTTNDDCGLLVRGFEYSPTIMMPYNPPEYAEWIEAAGFSKAKDLYGFRIRIPDHAPDQIERISNKVRDRFRVRVRTIDMKRFKEELGRVKDIYNSAWEKNWGFVPMTDHEIDHMAAQLKPAVVPSFTLFAEIDGETVGFLLLIPDVNIAMKPLRGRLFPFGIVRLLWGLPRIKEVRLMALGVKAGFRRRGIDAALIHEITKNTYAAHCTFCEVSWTLEDNDLVNSLVEVMGGERYKTYRIYERRL